MPVCHCVAGIVVEEGTSTPKAGLLVRLVADTRGRGTLLLADAKTDKAGRFSIDITALSADDTSYKSNDLHKMHAYRDAIPAARSAWIVYPGADDAAFLDDGRRGMDALVAGPLAGVGALSLRPDGARAGLAAVLRAILVRPALALAAG